MFLHVSRRSGYKLTLLPYKGEVVAVLRCTRAAKFIIPHHPSPPHHEPLHSAGPHPDLPKVIYLGRRNDRIGIRAAVRPLIIRSRDGFWVVLATSLKRVQAEQYTRTVYTSPHVSYRLFQAK
jgi:hypothetical protein